MESRGIRSRLSSISTYKREKSFKYPISHETPISPLLKKSSLREDSTSPTPLTIKSANYRQCPTDPNLNLPPLPLYSSHSNHSIKLSHKNLMNTDLSPCRTEILSRSKSKLKFFLLPISEYIHFQMWTVLFSYLPWIFILKRGFFSRM